MDDKTKKISHKQTKKPFDKKKWRENKYSHKAKVDKWTENRNKALQRKYFRMLKKENVGNGANAIPLGQKEVPKKSYKKTKEEFEKRKKQAENKQKREEKEKKYKERQEAIKIYKQEKARNIRYLAKRIEMVSHLCPGDWNYFTRKLKTQRANKCSNIEISMFCDIFVIQLFS